MIVGDGNGFRTALLCLYRRSAQVGDVCFRLLAKYISFRDPQSRGLRAEGENECRQKARRLMCLLLLMCIITFDVLPIIVDVHAE